VQFYILRLPRHLSATPPSKIIDLNIRLVSLISTQSRFSIVAPLKNHPRTSLSDLVASTTIQCMIFKTLTLAPLNPSWIQICKRRWLCKPRKLVLRSLNTIPKSTEALRSSRMASVWTQLTRSASAATLYSSWPLFKTLAWPRLSTSTLLITDSCRLLL